MTKALRPPQFLLSVIIALLAFFYWASALSFAPVPWPDDSAFFLVGIEWLSESMHYHMHAQAPFVPTYDIANFNTMPLMPLLLGLGTWIGIDDSHTIRLYGMFAYATFALLLAAWMRHRKAPESWVWMISLGAMLSPAIRWGAMIVRPEIWQGLFWLLILMDLDGFFKKPNAWRIPAILAVAAGVHFEAILWVLPTALAVAFVEGNLKKAGTRLLGIGWRTTVLLSPWLIYVLAHWNIFWIQMDTQFGRLEAHHPYMEDAYEIFHNFFLSLGNPVGYPKFFNPGKIITWSLMVGASIQALWLAVREQKDRGIRTGALAALGTTWYLWSTKPETWFTAMIHTALWTLFALVVPQKISLHSRLALIPFGALLVFQAGVAGDAWVKMRESFTWKQYHSWIDCIDQSIGDRTKIWQPHWPDILVELAGRKPGRDYTRAVDFRGVDHLITAHAHKSEAIIHSLYFELDAPHSKLDYQGEPRDLDRYYLTEYNWIPFRNLNALRMGKGWKLAICQRGPFWGAISLRNP